MRRWNRVFSICAWLVCGGWALPTLAAPELCESASMQVSSETGVPAQVLLALTLTETGRRMGGRLRPWPWAANGGGRGYWFETRQEAAQYAHMQLAQGRTNFDLGCFQINWHWHGAQFSRPEDLLDPLISGRYAARMMQALHAELGSWSAAAGAYHSRTPALATRYRARFDQVLAGLSDSPDTPPLSAPGMLVAAVAPSDFPPEPPAPRENRFPLLRPGDAQSLASLVPLETAVRPLIGPHP